jgi:ArsR family transcriptional regulator
MNHYQCEARLLKAIAHPIRLQILQALVAQPACVCDLVTTIKRSQPYISQHLMLLRDVGLVEGKREGWNIRYYVVHPELKDLLEAVHPLCQRKHTVSAHAVEPIELCDFNG